MNNSETKVDSSSAVNSSPVALVTASNLRKDTLCLPQDSSPTESINDGTQGYKNKKEYCMALERKKQHWRDPLSKRQFMILKLAHDSFTIGRQYLSSPLMRANGMTRLGMLTLVGRDGVKWQVNLRGEKFGKFCLGKGWKQFAMANGLKTGEFFTLAFVRENGIQMLRLINTKSTSNIRQIGESSKAMEEESFPTEASNINQEDKEKNNIESTSNRRQIGESSKAMEEELLPTEASNIDERSTNTSLLVQKLQVTLALEPKDVKAGTLYFPSQFVKAVGIKKLGKITLIGKDKMKWWGCLVSKDGTVAVGCGWRNFCEANGVKTGGSFTLEFIKEEEDTGPVFSFRPNFGE